MYSPRIWKSSACSSGIRVVLVVAVQREKDDLRVAPVRLGIGALLHRRGKELLKKLVTGRRLAASAAARPVIPTTDLEWCEEALASHRGQALTGVIVSDGLGPAFRGNPLVASIGKLTGAPWWAGRSPSIRLCRTLAAYKSALELVVRHSNSMMVIDPNGKITRVMSVPRSEDAGVLGGFIGNSAGFDAKGRLVYRAPFRFFGPGGPPRTAGGLPVMPTPPESAAIVIAAPKSCVSTSSVSG